MPYRRTGVGEKKREASTTRIVAAAQKLFMEKGYEATTMQDIVREADSSIGNLYFYFKNKEDLLKHLVEQSLLEGYTLGDELAAQAPRGPARLAVVMYANAARVWGPQSNTANLIAFLGDQPFAKAVLQRNTERVRSYLEDNFPSLKGVELEYAAAAWGVTGTAVAGAMFREPEETRVVWNAADFAVRWNLRGVGVSEPEIDEAIAIARRLVGV